MLGDENPCLFVVDTLARSFGGGDENSATDMGVFVRNCDIPARAVRLHGHGSPPQWQGHREGAAGAVAQACWAGL